MNQYERAARLEKAMALVTLFALHRIQVQDVALMNDAHWAAAAKAAGVAIPSWRTQQMVVLMMMRSN